MLVNIVVFWCLILAKSRLCCSTKKRNLFLNKSHLCFNLTRLCLGGIMEESKKDKVEEKSSSLPHDVDSKSAIKLKELNGRKGLEPTRYGDWEKNGRCIDF